jgi:GlpG protein
MSGVVYGLLGYLWMKMVYEPDAGMNVSGSTVVILLVWLVVCLFGLPDSGPRDSASREVTVQHVANMAHLTGLVAGTVVGYAPTAWRSWRS